MELTKKDTQMAKGIAIIGMLMLHLFCRLENLPYTPLLYIGDVPLIYYFGVFGDLCVPIYCFCSGYAHYLLREKLEGEYTRSIPKKLLRFLQNYWEILVIFTLVGLVSGNGDEIPRSFSDFLGNFFLYRLSYNGAWWFVITYIFLSLLSPVLIASVKRLPSILVLLISGVVYFVAYLFRFRFIFSLENGVLDWLWQQTILLGTSQFAYVIGLVCRKEQWVTKLRRGCTAEKNGEKCSAWKYLLKIFVWILPPAAFIGHCIVQSVFVSPFTAMAVLAFLFSVRVPNFVRQSLLFMGNHSTNIWFTHMFFYLTLFEGLVFVAKYPIPIFLMMLVITVGVSYVIQFVHKGISKLLKFKD